MARLIVAATACAGLAGVIAMELRADVGGGEPDFPPARAASGIALAPAALPVVADAVVQDVLARPLFTPNRQPSARSSAKAQGASDAFRRRLTGVAIGPAIRKAVFAGEGRDKPVVVAEGEALDGWTVDSVSAGAVTVRAGNASQIVEIAKPKSGDGPKTAQRADAAANSNQTGVPTTRRDR